VVAQGVRRVSDVLIPLVGILGGAVGTVGGYLVGVAQSRNERRDNALADIYKELALFHRYLTSWTADPNPDPNEPTRASGDIPAWKHVNDQYQKFTYTFHDVNAIWLGKDTYDLIQGFSLASRDLLNDLTHLRKRDGVWLLPDGKNPNDRREEQITKQYYKVRDALRAEVEASRNPVVWFRHNIVNRRNTRVAPTRDGSGEGE
jgi:hypothetical protein